MRRITRIALLTFIALPLAGIVGSALAAGNDASSLPSTAGVTTTSTPPTTAPAPTCSTPTTTHVAAPAVGSSAVFPAGTAGSVTLQRTSTTDLKVLSVKPASGWSDTVVASSGTKVRVHFRIVKPSGAVNSVRFVAHLNSTNTKVDVRIVACKA